MVALHDMHCHVDFMANGRQVAREAAANGTLLFANTVTPGGWESACDAFDDLDNVAVGFGMHPWWVDDPHDADRARALLAERHPRAIGEVGLDFGKRHAATADLQAKVFGDAMRWAADAGGRLVSIHSVHAARETLDVLESTGAVESCTCVFHWFTGPSDQMKRAVQMGCYFSFGTRALRTGKGREYVKAIPVDRLLLETDYPPNRGDACSYADLREQLALAAESIAAIKGPDAIGRIAATTEGLLAPFR